MRSGRFIEGLDINHKIDFGTQNTAFGFGKYSSMRL